jgi:hypothetical protein
MVKTHAFGMVVLLTLALAAGSGLASPPPPSTETDPGRAVGSALGKGSFPWYDSAKDQVKPMVLATPPKPWTGDWSWLRSVGGVMGLVFFGLALAALVAALVWFWRIYEPIDGGAQSGSLDARGQPSRIESLPEGMRREFESTDPWEEALRRRDRGDLAGAVVCLFAHQLLTLSRLGLVRLAPGRTGRQLLRSVADSEFRILVHPTLRLFEAVYYGHRTPSLEEFSSLWTQAEAFERRVAVGVVA